MRNTMIKSAVISVALSTLLSAAPFKDNKAAILDTYASIAVANYSDALKDAMAMESAIKAFAAAPSEATLADAKNGWLKARESYGTTEAFRLSNGPIDAEEGWIAESYGALEGQINAWPLDENMIDYTIDAEGKKTSGNIIDTRGKFNPGGEKPKEVDVTSITVDAITALNENGGEANVATGYHAIEFLLWGQDQDYSNFTK
ncbi:MAG: imelysin family protein, partial [Sulfuricurvum sp.]|nr:imelysin family protein [Sulfuricurvum sp.]